MTAIISRFQEAPIQLEQCDYSTVQPAREAPNSVESTTHEFPHSVMHMKICILANRDIKQMVLAYPTTRTAHQCVTQFAF